MLYVYLFLPFNRAQPIRSLIGIFPHSLSNDDLALTFSVGALVSFGQH